MLIVGGIILMHSCFPFTNVRKSYELFLQTIELHLQCLQFVLQEATGVFMSWSRVKEFWDCMVAKPEACEWDRNTCYTWLTERFQELEGEAACNLFTKKLMTDHSFGLSMEGTMYKCYFDNLSTVI